METTSRPSMRLASFALVWHLLGSGICESHFNHLLLMDVFSSLLDGQLYVLTDQKPKISLVG